MTPVGLSCGLPVAAEAAAGFSVFLFFSVFSVVQFFSVVVVFGMLFSMLWRLMI